MKRILLPMLLLIGGASIAQNVKDQKVNFQYVKLPSTPIKGTNTYEIEIDHSLYQANNDDSLSAFEVKVNLAEAQLNTWIEEKKQADKLYLAQMGTWETNQNKGVLPNPVPTRPAYNNMPTLKEELNEPLITEEIATSKVEGLVALEGFSKSSGGAVVKVAFKGFQQATIEMKKTGTGAETKYTYTAKYKMPVVVTITSPSQGQVLKETIGEVFSKKEVGKYSSQYDFEVWKIDNLNTFWKTEQKTLLNKMLNEVNALINDKCGFPLTNYSTEVYTVKKFKTFNYSDLIDAYTYAKQGYGMIFKEGAKSKADAKIQSGIQLWEAALQESTPSERKSRINEKVTALIFVNLAEAYLWKEEFDMADNYIQKAKMGGVMKYKNEAKDLEKILKDHKDRKIANN